MSRNQPIPSGREVHFREDEIIVSKTDKQGRITYANGVFQRVSGYVESELLGQPHNILRHPEMPRCIFKLVWDTLKDGREIFGYVVNLTKQGDHYWVFAHMTPSYDQEGRHAGYHSNRRVPYPDALAQVKPLYARLLEMEKKSSNPKTGMEQSYQWFLEYLKGQNMDYPEFVFNLSQSTRLTTSIS